MAKDDYFKIVFMILEYLYKCLREGESYIGIERVKAYAITDDIPLEYVYHSKKENVKALKISM